MSRVGAKLCLLGQSGANRWLAPEVIPAISARPPDLTAWSV
ncbi:hypothetical protein [Novosphingobium sp. MMS21-SN21R]|nr:hypothetical protein [Novosphingobium sp. MMS21-SN21R]MDT0510240.1 hypothetical protein [Novosphingobium sp. MMS21-SN21R]